KLSVDGLVRVGSFILVAVLFALAYLPHFFLVCAAMFVGGNCWLLIMSSFNLCAQTAVPAWVRARALSLYYLIFWGGMALGSILWGSLASHRNMSVALAT